MYSRRCPSGSRKNTDNAGIHAITTGSSVGCPSKSSGVMPADLRISGAATTSAALTRNAMCIVIRWGPTPPGQSPSIALPAGPIQKNAA